MTTPDQNKAIYQRYIDEIFNNANFDLLGELMSDTYIYHDAPPGTLEGPEGIKQVVQMFHGGFSDMKITLDEIIAERDLVSCRSTFVGTHTGTIFGMAATNNPVIMKGMTMVRIVDGKIAESWVKNDVLGLMNQLNFSS